MHVVVEVLSGPSAGRRIEVPAGAVAYVGKGEKAHLAIPQDTLLGAMHFALVSNGTHCVVRDLGSANGTYVNGLRVEEREIGVGDMVVAGMSSFRITPPAPAAPPPSLSLAAHPGIPITALRPPPPRPIPSEWGDPTPSQALLFGVLHSANQPVYAVLDAAREDRIPAFLQACLVEHASLYDGRDAYMLQTVAPYIAAIPKDSMILHLLAKEGWGKSWGTFFCSPRNLFEVRKHLQQFLSVRGETGAWLRFRFYDPRVMRKFLPGKKPDELLKFFGPVTRIVAEADDPVTALEYKYSPDGLKTEEFKLA